MLTNAKRTNWFAKVNAGEISQKEFDRAMRDTCAMKNRICRRRGRKSVQRSDGLLLRITPADLRAICDSLNAERDTGGQSKLARLLGWHYSTLWRKLNGLSRITHSDELAIRQAVTSLKAPSWRASSPGGLSVSPQGQR